MCCPCPSKVFGGQRMLLLKLVHQRVSLRVSREHTPWKIQMTIIFQSSLSMTRLWHFWSRRSPSLSGILRLQTLVRHRNVKRRRHHRDPFSGMDLSTPWKSCRTYLFKWMERTHCKLRRDSLPSKPANPKWFGSQVLLRIHSCNEDPTYSLLGPEGNPLFVHVPLQLLQEGFRYLRAHQLRHAWYELLPRFHHRIRLDLSPGLRRV